MASTSASGAVITSNGTGPLAATITITGTGGGSGPVTGYNSGVRVGGTIRTVDGAVNVVGTAGIDSGNAVFNSYGVFVGGSSGTILATGHGLLNVAASGPTSDVLIGGIGYWRFVVRR